MSTRGKKWIFIIFLLILPSYLMSQDSETKDSVNPRKNAHEKRIRLSKKDYTNTPFNDISGLLESQESFSIFKNNYFISGIPTNKKVTKSTADAKFQISIKQRLVNIDLPFNSFLYLTYTQKSFWDVYELSSPFADNNYNPGLLWATPLSFDNFRGIAAISVEHESNGEGGDDSRCWNFVSLSCSYFISNNFSTQLKAWYGWTLKENPDLHKYKGYGLVALNYRTKNNRFWASFVINPCKGFRAYNTQLEVNFKISTKLNQYFFVQWYNGYAESLLEYDKYSSMVRAGICLKPQFINIY